MKNSGNYLLTGAVHVDEFYVGGEEEEIYGRSADSKKKLVVVALEVLEGGGLDRAYGQIIDDASASSFRPFFERYIRHEAKIVTDEWNGYKPLMDKFKSVICAICGSCFTSEC